MSTMNRGLRAANLVAVITGGAGGIGRATSVLLAKEGAAGIVVADTDEKAGLVTVELANAATVANGGKPVAVFHKVDVSKAADCEAMVQRAEKEFGRLTTLFNNAGVMDSTDSDAVNTEEKVWDRTMAINVKGIFLGCKYGIPAMIRAGGGTVINTASFVSFMGAATPQLAYTASKGAVLSMTRELAVTHARQNIRINAICPGPMNSPLLRKILDTEEKRQRRLVHVPMGRFGECEEMAQAVLFLASNESSFITGTSLVVDGGVTGAYITPEEKVDAFSGPSHLRKG